MRVVVVVATALILIGNATGILTPPPKSDYYEEPRR